GGRVLDEHGEHGTGVYATGWSKRGPVGLIGHTKSDARETIENLVADLQAAHEAGTVRQDVERDDDALLERLHQAGVEYTSWHGWELLDAHERSLGEEQGRERVKVVPRDHMPESSRGLSARA